MIDLLLVVAGVGLVVVSLAAFLHGALFKRWTWQKARGCLVVLVLSLIIALVGLVVLVVL